MAGGRRDDVLERGEAVEEGLVDGRVGLYGREGYGGRSGGGSGGEVGRGVCSLRVLFLDNLYLDHFG